MPITFPVMELSPSKQAGSKVIKAAQYARYLVCLFIYIIKARPDVVHFQFFRRQRLESLYFLFLRLMRIKLLYTVHDLLPHEKGGIDHFFNSLVYKASGRLVVHSEYLKDQLAVRFNIPTRKIKTIPHGNFDIYVNEQWVSKHDARKRFNLTVAHDVLLFFGHIRKYKGLDLLVRAFERAAQSNERLILIIAGRPYTEELACHYDQVIGNSGAKERIIYHAEFIPAEKIGMYFVASDVVVLPYENIYHSGVVHLAYSFGRAIIASRVGDLAEMVEGDRTGYVVKANDEDGLSAAIVNAVGDKDKLAKMGRLARELSETKYGWGNIACWTKDAYEELRSGGRGPNRRSGS
jgi:glycosyltransferase involved in cell wall biosynthesis